MSQRCATDAFCAVGLAASSSSLAFTFETSAIQSPGRSEVRRARSRSSTSFKMSQLSGRPACCPSCARSDASASVCFLAAPKSPCRLAATAARNDMAMKQRDLSIANAAASGSRSARASTFAASSASKRRSSSENMHFRAEMRSSHTATSCCDSEGKRRVHASTKSTRPRERGRLEERDKSTDLRKELHGLQLEQARGSRQRVERRPPTHECRDAFRHQSARAVCGIGRDAIKEQQRTKTGVQQLCHVRVRVWAGCGPRAPPGVAAHTHGAARGTPVQLLRRHAARGATRARRIRPSTRLDPKRERRLVQLPSPRSRATAAIATATATTTASATTKHYRLCLQLELLPA
eukprot:1974948-Pleurochrysis_carterae.AAC.2